MRTDYDTDRYGELVRGFNRTAQLLHSDAESGRYDLVDMRSIEVAQIALGACNFATASAQCRAVGLGAAAAEHAVRQLAEQLPAKNVIVSIEQPADAAYTDFMRDIVVPMALATLTSAEDAVAVANLPQEFTNKITRVKDLLNDKHCDMTVASALLIEVVHDLIDELSEPMFLHIDPSKRSLYEQKEPPFGAAVDAAFPDSSKEVASAARCLALDEWTACVLHLMRALEAPLHKCADKMSVTFPSPLDLENWRNIIDALEAAVNKRVKEQEATRKSHDRNEELKRLGEIAVLFRHFKNAWRNDAAHGRQAYDEREAQRVYDNVRVFMQTMVEIVR